MEEKEILEKVCKKMGTGIPDGWKDSSIAIYSMPLYKGIYNKSLLSLRGFLTHPDTAKAIWGEEPVCDWCGKKLLLIPKVQFNCDCTYSVSRMAWQYHNAITANMESVREILEYMSKYL